MTYDKFLYYVRTSGYGLQVDIGYFDPERFDGEGGLAFGLTSHVLVEDESWGGPDGIWHVKVSQVGNSFCEIEEAQLRAEVSRQALEMACFIRDQLAMGESLEKIIEFLDTILEPGQPIEGPWRYSGATKAKFGHRGVGG